MNSNCQTKSKPSISKDDTPAIELPEITIDGQVIDESEIAEELQYHKAKQLDQVVQMAAQAIVIRKLLLKEVLAKGQILNQQNEETLIQELLDSKLQSASIDQPTCSNYYNQNLDKFKTQPLLEVDHILLAAAPDDIKARDQAKTLAYQLIDQLKTTPSQFVQLAKDYSACPSKAMGGNLGQISKGQTVEEFEQQVTRLPAGLSTKPIESRYGFHIVKIANRIDGRQLEFSMVEQKIKQYLEHRQARLTIQSYIHSLSEKAQIKGFKLSFEEENIHI